MDILFKKIETYVYSAVGAAVMAWAAHHPMYHDIAVWFLGVLGTAIGVKHGEEIAKNGG